MSYLPIPPRVWSRVQNECSVNTSSSNLVFEPLTGQYVTQEEYNRLKQIQIKGNILQYKNNSSNLTKKQKYSKIAKGQWTNRTKTWATQSLTYSNPNTTSLQRVNTSTLAATANTPFVTNTYSITPNPFNCSVPSIADIPDGGNLVATVTVNPCTNEIIKTTTITNCSLSTDSDVPGPPIALCWNPKLPTYYPKQNLTNNNSTDKWPFNYKGLVSALRPIPPILILDNVIDNTVYLSWTYDNKSCIPITSFNLYQILDGVISLINTIPFPITSTILYNLINCTNYTFYVTALSTNIESEKSNEISVFIRVLYGPTITNIEAGCNSALLTWEPPNITCIDIVGYYIYKNNVKITALLTLPILFPYTVTPLSPCADYDFNVSYFDSISNKESYLSNTATVTEIPCPPTIIDISFNHLTNSQDISFNIPISTCTVTSYRLYQTIDPSNNYSSIVASPKNLTAANLQAQLPSINYSQGEHTFYMTSYSTDNNTESINSNYVTIPPPPINLTCSLTSTPGEINLTWTNQTPVTLGLSINKNKVYSNNTLFATIDPSSNSYTMTGLTVGNTYTITVTAVATDISGNITESIYSNPFPISLPNLISISNLNYQNTDLTFYAGNYNYGVLIFSDIGNTGTVDISYNYTISKNINVLTIGSGGNGGLGGGKVPAGLDSGGGGGGGGGGYFNNAILTGDAYNLNITIGQQGSGTSINSICIASGGDGGGGGGYAGASQAGSGGSGGKGNGDGGPGDTQNTGNGSSGKEGSPNSYYFIVNGITYNFYFGGGGGGGHVDDPGNNNYSGGNSCGGAGGYGYGAGQRSGFGGALSIPNNYSSPVNISCGGGGGGGSGLTASDNSGLSGYSGGAGSQGIAAIWWDFTV